MRKYIILFLSIAFMLFSMYPAWYEIERKDTIRDNRTFELVHNFYTDFNFYLSRIRQGLEGNLTVHEKYTSEPHNGSFIHILYLAMGWVGRWVRVPWHRTADIYHAARAVLAVVLLVMFGVIARRSFPQKTEEEEKKKGPTNLAILAFLLSVTASTWTIFVTLNDGSFRFGGYMPWWSVMDSLQRIAFIPHLLFGQILMAFLLFAISDIQTMKRVGNWIFLGVLAFVEGIVFPPGLIFVIASIPFIVAMEYIFAKPRPQGNTFIPWAIAHLLPRAVVVFLGIPALIYLQLMTSFFPWKQLALADIEHPLPYKFWEYMQAMGIILPLGVAGLLLALRNRQKQMIMSIAWVITWAFCLWIFTYIPAQSPLRFSEMIPHLPLGILAAYFFYVCANACSRKWVKTKSFMRIIPPHFRTAQTGAAFVYLFPIILLCMNMFHMYSSSLWQTDFVDHKIRGMYPLVPTGSYVMYPLTDFINAIRWLQDHTSRDTVILSETTAGNYIPVYSGNTVYVGHDNTVRNQEKKLFVNSFYSAKMPADQAKQWLAEENLHYVFFGPQEKEDGGITDLQKVYSFLEPIYQGEYIVIYFVK
jgi:hypothetical protein